MERNATPEGRTVDDHQFVRPDENTKIPSHLTNNSPIVPASSLPGNFPYIPEDSCDSIFSVDDQDDDDDDDSTELSAKSMSSSSQAGRPYQGILSGRIAKSQEPSAVEELQALMQSVREESGSKDKSENVLDGGCENPETSSMEVEYQRATVPNLEMVEQPEESYRARYESEGCRGPIRGVVENGFPTVKVNGYTGNVAMTVFLVTKSGEPHLHSITGPGSTKTPCKEVTLEDNISGIQTWIGPEQNMTAVWDSLSVCRIRNWDADKKLRERGEDPTAWKNKKKEARLMFQCTIPQTSDRPGYILTCQSRPFLCTAPFGNPEIWWMSEKESFPKGGKEAAVIGKKFSTGFRVRFYSNDSEGLWESLAEIDKSKSHQGAIVFKIPAYKAIAINKPVKVSVEVRVGPEKDRRSSESVSFHYIPESDGDHVVTKSCSQCDSIKNALSHLFENDSNKIKTEPNMETSLKTSCLETDSSNTFVSESMRNINNQEANRERQNQEERDRIIEQIKSLQSLPNIPNIPLIDNTKQSTRPLVDDVRGEFSEKKLKTSLTNFVTTSMQAPPQVVDYPKTVGVILQNQNQTQSPNVSITSSAASTGNFFAVASNSSQLQIQKSDVITSYQLSGAAQTNTYTGLASLQQPHNITLLPASLPSNPQQPMRVCVVDNQHQQILRAYAPVQSINSMQPLQNLQPMQQPQPFNALQIHSSSQTQEQVPSFHLQSTRPILQVQPAQSGQYIQHVAANQPVHQASQSQVASNGTLLRVNQNAPSSIGTSQGARFVVLSNPGIVSAVEHVKQESAGIKRACENAQTSVTPPQISNVWSFTQVSKQPVQVLTTLPAQQTFISQSSNAYSNITGSAVMSQLPQMPALSHIVPQSSSYLPSGSSIGQILIQSHQVQAAAQQTQAYVQPVQSSAQHVQCAMPHVPSAQQPVQSVQQSVQGPLQQQVLDVQHQTGVQQPIQSVQQQLQGLQQQSQDVPQQVHSTPKQVQNVQQTTVEQLLDVQQQILNAQQQAQVVQQGVHQLADVSQQLSSSVAFSVQNQKNNFMNATSYMNMAVGQSASYMSAIAPQPASFVSGSYAVSPAQSILSTSQTEPGLYKQIDGPIVDKPAVLSNPVDIISVSMPSIHVGIATSTEQNVQMQNIHNESCQNFVPSESDCQASQPIDIRANEVRKSSWPAQHSNVEDTKNHFSQHTPLLSSSSTAAIDQQLNSYQNTADHGLFVANPSVSVTDNAKESGNTTNVQFGLINYQPTSQAYQLTRKPVTSTMGEIPSDSNMQIETAECWTASNQVQNSTSNPAQDLEEPGKILSSGLAQDLNRLSVVGCQFQPSSMQSEPISIPTNDKQYSVQPEPTASPYCDPQPMSLTEDPIPAEIMSNRLMKDQQSELVIQSEFRSSDGDSESKLIHDAIQNERQSSVLLVSEQQQLADSFLVPQKDLNVENIHATQVNQLQDHDQINQLKQTHDQQIINHYISQYDQLKNLTEQQNVGNYHDEYGDAKTIDNNSTGNQLNNQIQSPNESFSSNNSYQQSFQTADSVILGSVAGHNSSMDVNAINCQSKASNDIPASSTEVWRQQTMGISNSQLENNMTSGWNPNQDAIASSEPKMGQNPEVSFSTPSSANQMGTVFNAQSQGNSMDIETFHVQDNKQQQLLRNEDKQQLFMNDPFLNSHQTDEHIKQANTQFSLNAQQNIEIQQVEVTQTSSTQSQQYIPSVQQNIISQQQCQDSSYQAIQQKQQQYQPMSVSSMQSYTFEPQFQAANYQSLQQQSSNSIEMPQEQHFEQSQPEASGYQHNSNIENQQHSYVDGVVNQPTVISENNLSSEGQISNQRALNDANMYSQHMNGGINDSVEEERRAVDIPFNAEQAKQTEWNELVEDTKRLLAEGLLKQKEAHTIFSCVQQEDHLLLEMYRTSRMGTDNKSKVIETLKHWVLNVKHISA